MPAGRRRASVGRSLKLLLAVGLVALVAAPLHARADGRAVALAAQEDDRATGLSITPPAYLPGPVRGDGYQPPVPLLWKVSDHDTTLWLLGAFHLLKEDDYPLSPDVALAFFEADKLVFELAPDELDGPHTQARFTSSALFADGRRLGDVLPGVTHEKLARLLARQGGSIDQVSRYQPWFINLSLVLGLAHSMDYQPELGVDRFLMDRAAEAGKPVGGLETLDAQLSALAGAPMDEQVLALEEYLDNPEQMPERLDRLHAAWRDGDPDRLERLTRLEMLHNTPDTYRLVNVERNDAWLERLDAMLRHDPGDVLVVVGALHLLGEDGLVERLGGLGYQVERICSQCAANDDVLLPADAIAPAVEQEGT